MDQIKETGVQSREGDVRMMPKKRQQSGEAQVDRSAAEGSFIADSARSDDAPHVRGRAS